MIRSMLMMAMAVVLMSSDAFAGGGGKANGTLVVRNTAAVSVAVVVDPPAAWASWIPGAITDAQKAELTKRATIVVSGGSQSCSIKKGAHKVLAVNTDTEEFILTDVTVVSKQTTTISVDP